MIVFAVNAEPQFEEAEQAFMQKLQNARDSDHIDNLVLPLAALVGTLLQWTNHLELPFVDRSLFVTRWTSRNSER